MNVRVGKGARIVIPAVIRRSMGVEDGDLLDVRLDDDGRLILERVDPDPLQRVVVAGSGLWAGVDPVQEQGVLRAEWDR